MQFDEVDEDIQDDVVAQVEDKMSKVLISLAKKYDSIMEGFDIGGDPYIFNMLSTSKHICTRSINTAATDGFTYYWNPEFVLGTSLNGLRLVCFHEVHHTIYMHVDRIGLRDRLIWNYAVDYIVNHFAMDDARVRGLDPLKFFTENLGECIGLNECVKWLKDPTSVKYEGKVAYFADSNLPNNMLSPELIYNYLISAKNQNQSDNKDNDKDSKESPSKKDKPSKDNGKSKDSSDKKDKGKDGEGSSDEDAEGKGKGKASGGGGSSDDSDDDSDDSGEGSSDKKDKGKDGEGSSDEDSDEDAEGKGKGKASGGGGSSDDSDDSGEGSSNKKGKGKDSEEDPSDEDSDSKEESSSDKKVKNRVKKKDSGDASSKKERFKNEKTNNPKGIGTLDDHIVVKVDPDKLIKKMKRAAKTTNTEPGSVPGLSDSEEQINLVESKMSWQTFIKSKLQKMKRENGDGRSDWTRFKSKYMFSGVLIPKRKKHLMTFGCMIDTSGSMSTNDISFGISQLKSLDKDTEGTLTCADVGVYWDSSVKLDKIDPDELKSVRIVGRGGTHFDSYFTDYEKNIGKCDFLVIITDGYVYIDPKKKPEIDVYWLITSTCDFVPPFGHVFSLHNL